MPMATTLKRDRPPPENRSSSPSSAWLLNRLARADWLAPGTATLAKSRKTTRIPPVNRSLLRSSGSRTALTNASRRFIRPVRPSYESGGAASPVGPFSAAGSTASVAGVLLAALAGGFSAGCCSGTASGSSGGGVLLAVLAAVRLGPILRGSPSTLTLPPEEPDAVPEQQ